jgi:hypothetical protein
MNDTEFVTAAVIVTAFCLGRWSAQRSTEKFNDVMRRMILGTLDHLRDCEYLNWSQKDRLSDHMVSLLPLRERWKLRRHVNEEMRRRGLL